MDIINMLRNKLSAFFDKILAEDQGLFHSLILYYRGEPSFIVCLPKKPRKKLYAKIADLGKVSSLDCSMLLYEPWGLYIFARNPDELIDKLLKKLEIGEG